jgi:hypothetical protein
MEGLALNESSFTCVDCGRIKETKIQGVTTGYAINSNGQKVCYDCCAVQDRKWMDDNDRISLYLSFKEDPNLPKGFTLYKQWSATNWPGTLSFNVSYRKTGKHNFAGIREDVWFRDHAGRQWHGVCYGHNTQILHCRKLK